MKKKIFIAAMAMLLLVVFGIVWHTWFSATRIAFVSYNAWQNSQSQRQLLY